jgi:hypothetical protein
MGLGLRDTTAEAEAVYVEAIRRMQPTDKLRRVSELTCSVRALALGRLRRDFPNASFDELHRRLAARTLGPAIARQV